MTTPLATLAFAADGGRTPLEVVALEGREALSSFFEFDLTLASRDEHLASSRVIGERASLHMEHGVRSRTVHGIVRTFEQGDAVGSVSTYRATLAPATYVLALREDCRIFQGRRAPEIIASVLEAAGFTTLDYKLFLHDAYTPREHCVQYRETDWSFLLRLLQAEGIHCFFEHEDDREVLVFADTPFAHRHLPDPRALPFVPQGGALVGGERVERFRHTEELRARTVALRGHSFRRPLTALESRAEAERAGIALYDAPPAFDAPELGERLARIRLEQEATSGGTAQATSDCLGVQPGIVFALRDHGCEPLNREWLVTSAEHRATSLPASGAAVSARYGNRFTCIPSDVPFRATARAPKPALGIQTAVVVGPPGEQVHCDDLGRVKVQFHWDREGRRDERSSSWIRVSQAWAGRGYGTLFIPRVGDQVLIDFVDGDLDRPIVVGSVYDGVNVPPASLPEQRTTTAIRSSSSPGGAGQSELRFEDQSGRERVFLGSHRDLGIDVGQDRAETIGRDDSLEVGGDREETVAGSETHTIGLSRNIAVAGAQTVNVGQDEMTTVGGASIAFIGGARELTVGGEHAETVNGSNTVVIGKHLRVRVGGDKTEKVGGSSRESVEGERSLEAGRYVLDVDEKMRATVAGDHEEHAAGTRRISAGEVVELVCGEATITANKDGTITLVGKNVRVKVAGPVEVEGEKLSIKSEGAVDVSAGGSVKVRGRAVNSN